MSKPLPLLILIIIGDIIEAAKTRVRTSVSSWWDVTSSAVIKWWGDSTSGDVESEDEFPVED